MKPALHVLCWVLLLVVFSAGTLGAVSYRIPATGLVVGPTLLWITLRHGLAGPRLLWGSLTGHLPIASWPEALEVVVETRRFGIAVGATASAAGAAALLLGAPEVLLDVGVQALLHTTAPLLIASGLSVALWRPLEAHIARSHGAWLCGLREALTPPEHAPVAPMRRKLA